MHELSLAIRVIELAEEHLRAAGGERVVAATLRIGRLAVVDPDALQRALVLAADGTPLERAAFNMVDVPVRIHCPACRRDVDLPGIVPLACPECGARGGAMLAGGELELESLEIACPEEASA
jgi:hydrogenase nickel incorporation protein HypA/HybF